MGGSGTVGSYTMYVNPFMVVTNMKFTKHFYIEGQRIVSKLGEMGEYQYLLNPKDTVAGGGTIDFDLKGKDLKEAIYANFEDLGLDGAVFTAGKSGKVPYGRLKKYYGKAGTGNNGGNPNPSANETTSNKVENLQFYYHPDHLGSSSYITDASGEVYQHMEYFPFGETFVEERSDTEYTNYLYNGKELDEETGLYYYGARYYDPRISTFYGVDPLAEKYYSISPYAYCANNPILFLDPDGNDILIWYKNDKGKSEFYRYTGGNVKHSNSFVNSVVKAYNYNISNGGGAALKSAATDHSVNVNLSETSSSSISSYQGDVYWNPENGLKTKDGDVLSPATILEHEIDHGYDKVKKSEEHDARTATKDANFTNAEEKRVITGNESKTASANGEIGSKKVSRNEHNRGTKVIVDGGVTSTKVNQTKTNEFNKRLENERNNWSSKW